MLNARDAKALLENTGINIAKLPRVGRVPAAQFMGPGMQTVTLEGVIYPHFRGGLRQLEVLRLIARQGPPLMLVDGLGLVWERWIITGVEESKTFLMADGALRLTNWGM